MNIHIIACAQNNRANNFNQIKNQNIPESSTSARSQIPQTVPNRNMPIFNQKSPENYNLNYDDLIFNDINNSFEIESEFGNAFPLPFPFHKKGTTKSGVSGVGSASNSKMHNFVYDDRPFEIKILELKSKLQGLKVDWREAHCSIELNRESLLKESMKKYDKIDPYKELKINFKGEISHDAGGLIREWFTVLIKEIQSPQLCKINKYYICF